MERRERLSATRVCGKNSIHIWWRVKNPLITAINYCVIQVSKKIPSLTAKNLLLSCIGIRIGNNASIAPDVDLDFLYPELVEIGENSVIGYGATLLSHEFLVEEMRVGEVRIGKNVLIGAKSLVLAGVHIGNNSKVGAGSVVTKDVKAGSFVAGVPAEERKRD